MLADSIGGHVSAFISVTQLGKYFRVILFGVDSPLTVSQFCCSQREFSCSRDFRHFADGDGAAIILNGTLTVIETVKRSYHQWWLCCEFSVILVQAHNDRLLVEYSAQMTLLQLYLILKKFH